MGSGKERAWKTQGIKEFFFTGNNDIMKVMETIVKKIDKNNIDADIIQEAGDILRRGGLVAFPTETVYGLGANALEEKAAKKTYAAKGRPSDNPLIVHIADYEDLRRIAVNIPPETDALAAHFWPGPLTMIFWKSDVVPYGTTGGLETVAVRMPSDPAALALIRAAGGFVSAPSANTSGRPSPTTAEHVIHDLNGKIDMVIDGGAVDIGVESTILDMTVSPPMILRPGAVTAEMFAEVIGPVDVDRTILDAESGIRPKAPGMKYRHYAPKARLMIVEGDIREEILAIRQLAYAAHRRKKKIGIIATSETLPFYNYGIIKNAGTRENEKTIARNLYKVLREFDQEDAEVIYSESFAVQGIGKAVMNRLEKAAGHQKITAADIVKLQKYRRIIFVSGTDSARGPIAAELLRNQDLEQEYVVDSRGMVVLFPEPVNQKAEAVMRSVGMTMEPHISQQFEGENILDDTLVLTMEESQKDKLRSEYENIRNIYTLNEFTEDTTEIPNPYGKPLTAYGECLEKKKKLIAELAEKLNSSAEGEKEWGKYM